MPVFTAAACRRRLFAALALVAALQLVSPALALARDFYVAPNGSRTNDGSLGSPLDLATAISSATPARPGDTIWMRGGVYRGSFTSSLTGTAAAPITLRQYPGERATIDNVTAPTSDAFIVNGSYAIYRDFEITNTATNRATPRGAGLAIYGPNTKFINMVVHDAGVGVGFWTPAVNAELYGLIIYNNGIDTDRGHGHSLYTQNDAGIKRIVDSIMLNSYSFGIHAYTEGGRINRFHMEGNVLFNHGIVSAASGAKSNLLLGGGQVSYDSAILSNYTYYPYGMGGRGADIAFGTPCQNARVERNVLVGETALNWACNASVLSGNTLYGGVNGNAKTAFPNNTYLSARPTSNWTFVRPNQYEPGRANIVVYNWTRQSQVSVDIRPAGLNVGDQFEIRDAQNFYGPPVVTGTYSGAPVPIPMSGLSAAQIIGSAPRQPQHTGPDFGAFVVRRRSGGEVPLPATPTADLTAAPASIAAGQSSVLSWNTANAATVNIQPGIGAVAASGSRTVTPAATTTYTLTATSATGAAVTRTATVTVGSAGSGAIRFLGTDTTTRGSWKGVYGGDGHAINGQPASNPAYAQVGFAGQDSWVWAASTGDVRALQKTGSTTDRIASTWHGNAFTVDVNVTDGQEHRLAVYLLDWDNAGRVQTVEILDGATGGVVDVKTASDFANGRYLSWNVKGRVKLRITRLAGPNAVLSGLFFGGASGTGGSTQPPPSGAASATFLRQDTTTRGTWNGVYGAEGYTLANIASRLPSYAQVTFRNQGAWTWAASTPDARALQKPGSAERVAATWHGLSFTIEVNLTDGLAHRVALYGLDFDTSTRGQTVEVLDAASGAVLDRRTLTSFSGGQYLVWNLTGRVIIRVTRTAGTNAVVGGLFFDRSN